MMNHLKDYHVSKGIYHCLTYADKEAIGKSLLVFFSFFKLSVVVRKNAISNLILTIFVSTWLIFMITKLHALSQRKQNGK